MKKFVIFIFLSLIGCSPAQNISPVPTPTDIQPPSLSVTQTTISPTLTLIPSETLTPTPNSTPIGGGTGKIAFTSDRDGIIDIYVINSDGSFPQRLANNIAPKFSPTWSPDGTKIGFGSNTDDSASLYIMNADGSEPTQIIGTTELIADGQATPNWRFHPDCCKLIWSSNGQKIAFSIFYHHVECCRSDIDLYLMNIDGSNLVTTKGYPWGISSWSTDSRKILFTSIDVCNGIPGICLINADGTNPTNLSHKMGYGGVDGEANWSPDNERIVFSSGRNGDREIFVMNADGTHQINLTQNGKAWDGGPIWSPDGNKIAFSSYRDGNFEIYVMDPDGTNLINLTNHLANDNAFVWSPDSKKIAFGSDRDGNAEIYVIDSDGSNLTNLSNNDANDYSPVWAP